MKKNGEKLYAAVKTIVTHCQETACIECQFKSMPNCPGSWLQPDLCNLHEYLEHSNEQLDIIRRLTAGKGN